LLDLTTGEQSGHFSRKRDAREYADKVIAERKVSQAEQARRKAISGGRFRSGPHKPARKPDWQRNADHIDGYDHDDLGESPNF